MADPTPTQESIEAGTTKLCVECGEPVVGDHEIAYVHPSCAKDGAMISYPVRAQGE